MKKLFKLLLFLILTISGFLYWLSRPAPSQPPIKSSLPSTSPNQILDNLTEIKFNSQLYHFASVLIPDPSRLQLFSNHQTQASSLELLQTHTCSFLTNGNFYDTKDQPLGWLVSQGKTLSPAITSSLFNGFFSLVSHQPSLDFTQPAVRVDLGLQSGPLLIFNSVPLSLKLTSDQPRRRMILALNDQSQVIFLTLAGSDSPFSGPLLVDTPALILAVAETLNQRLVSALNLDGGSASAFHLGSIHLNELNFIGSFFCYNGSI